MKIDGKQIASEILENLKIRVEKLKKEGVIPGLSVMLVGNNPASIAYVKQKEIKATEIGAKVSICNLPETISEKDLISLIEKLNSDPLIHGLIVQSPLPSKFNEDDILLRVKASKDIDSFHPDSPFPMPLAKAVIKILEEVFKNKNISQSFSVWLKLQNIVVIGKGKTGGGPTIKMLKNLDTNVQVIDHTTVNPENLTKNADIIVSAVGKPDIVKPESIKKEVILISVGLHKEADGKLHGDYKEEDVRNIASFYTPTPKGVGPINVAMLLENLVTSSEKSFLH